MDTFIQILMILLGYVFIGIGLGVLRIKYRHFYPVNLICLIGTIKDAREVQNNKEAALFCWVLFWPLYFVVLLFGAIMTPIFNVCGVIIERITRNL